MNQGELKRLIESDEKALKLFMAGIDNACADRCTEIAPPLTVSVPCQEVRKLASLSGAWAKIVLASRESSKAPDEVKGVCITFVDWINNVDAIDFALPEVQMMAAGLVQSGIVTKEQVENLVALGQKPQVFSHSDIASLRD